MDKKNIFSAAINSPRSPSNCNTPVELSWTLLTTNSISRCHFIFWISQDPVLFLCLLLIYLLSLRSTCYTLFFPITSIKSLWSTPWSDLCPVLSFKAYDFSPRSLYQVSPSISSCLRYLLFCTIHISLLCWPYILPWHSHTLRPVRTPLDQHYFSPWALELLFMIPFFYGTP